MKDFENVALVLFLLLFFFSSLSSFILYLTFVIQVKDYIRKLEIRMNNIQCYGDDTRTILNEYAKEWNSCKKTTDYEYKGRGTLKRAKKKTASRRRRRLRIGSRKK